MDNVVKVTEKDGVQHPENALAASCSLGNEGKEVKKVKTVAEVIESNAFIERSANNERGNMNTNSIKWNKRVVLEELQIILHLIYKDSDMCFIKEATTQRNYNYTTLANKIAIYSKDDTIRGAWDRIKGILEMRSVKFGLNKRHDAQITKFHLINNFNWQDKQVLDHQTTFKDVKDKDLRDEVAGEIVKASK